MFQISKLMIKEVGHIDLPGVKKGPKLNKDYILVNINVPMAISLF